MVPEIWSTTDRIFSHFGPLLALLPPSQPSKSSKHEKMPSDIILLPMCTINEDHVMYGSWDIKAQRTEFFVILGHFLPFDSPNNPKNQNYEQLKKNNWRYHFKIVYHKWSSYDAWFLRYRVQQAEFLLLWTIFCSLPPLTTQKIKIDAWRCCHVTHVYHEWKSYDVWFLRYRDMEIWSATDRIFSHFGPFSALLTPPPPNNNPENQNFEKMKKSPEDIIILHKCTINDNHMMDGSWNMMCNKQNFLSFWAIFCPFTLLTTQKVKTLKKWKEHLEISSFYTSETKIIIIRYTVPEIRHVTDVTVIFHLGYFLPFYSCNSQTKIKKMKK